MPCAVCGAVMCNAPWFVVCCDVLCGVSLAPPRVQSAESCPQRVELCVLWLMSLCLPRVLFAVRTRTRTRERNPLLHAPPRAPRHTPLQGDLTEQSREFGLTVQDLLNGIPSISLHDGPDGPRYLSTGLASAVDRGAARALSAAVAAAVGGVPPVPTAASVPAPARAVVAAPAGARPAPAVAAAAAPPAVTAVAVAAVPAAPGRGGGRAHPEVHARLLEVVAAEGSAGILSAALKQAYSRMHGVRWGMPSPPPRAPCACGLCAVCFFVLAGVSVKFDVFCML